MFCRESTGLKMTGTFVPYDRDIPIGLSHALRGRTGCVTLDQNLQSRADVLPVAFQGDAALNFYQLCNAPALDVVGDIIGVFPRRNRVFPLGIFEDIGRIELDLFHHARRGLVVLVRL